MNRCKDCKYFERYNNEYNSNKYGNCKCSKFIYGDSGDVIDKEKADKLFYMDYEWYNASFEVGQDFGCIHFEERRGEYE